MTLRIQRDMKRSAASRPSSPRAWRVFAARDGRQVEVQIRQGAAPCCPCCGDLLEARGASRLQSRLPLDARAFDLECRDCRRFWSVVHHTERSIRLVRMRRFVAAVRAVDRPLAAPVMQAPMPA